MVAKGPDALSSLRLFAANPDEQTQTVFAWVVANLAEVGRMGQVAPAMLEDPLVVGEDEPDE